MPSLLRLLTPTLSLEHVRDATPERLRALGVRAVVADLDNTLVAYKSDAVAEEVAAWLTDLRGAGLPVCIASNTRRFRRLEQIAGRLRILHVPHFAGKPGTKGLLTALSLLQTAPAEAAMVGDQIFTDILAGNRLGMPTVLVNPLSPAEFIGTRLISRPLERLLGRR